MDFVTEMTAAIGMGLEEFKAFVNNKVKINKDYLEQLFWLPDGSQMTVLNFLISVCPEKKEGTEEVDSSDDLTDKIDYVVSLAKDANVGEPLHQAVASGKTRLALHLLGEDRSNELHIEHSVLKTLGELRKKKQEFSLTAHSASFDVNRRDSEGRSLISLILNTKNIWLLLNFLLKGLGVHMATSMADSKAVKVAFQPLHQAVALDLADGVRLLASEGAVLSNPFGVLGDTPVSLAARLGKINALEALLEFPVEQLVLEAENKHLFEDRQTGYTAMDELCERIANGEEKENALRGVAMLLCRGAEPPRSDAMRQLLSSNRVDLLKAVHEYLLDKPELVDAFVNRCHLTESPLHYIIYADHSWGSSIRHLFGMPSDAAFMLEDLVIKKYSNPALAQSHGNYLSTSAVEDFSKETDPLKLYAEFVRRYKMAYDSQLIPNRWSTMRWMIAEGRCDWETVKRYSSTNPTSRTRIILHEMFNPIPKIHDDLDSQPESHAARAI
ncbi:Dot/Icm T4SS effector AnkC/LegA12 [Legionella shakespearei]|uniref:Ankyrin repeat-containing protein n=1 Tax=Legionella shakespearei DSM 23087 TaxID=1122169 RepID=A0A0W0ZF04_9GAMM|nr:Dot/Icm T4SS effector AnkC/LegA12 [Legionella shakespearei]KTD67514.1 ankyrin repeat-containing protein [Legionella shakespearei DSM 23087]